MAEHLYLLATTTDADVDATETQLYFKMAKV
jgi:hypothetical protein